MRALVEKERQYIVGPDGRKKAVILDLDEYRRLIEDYRDLQVVAHRKKNVKIAASEFISRLKMHGRL